MQGVQLVPGGGLAAADLADAQGKKRGQAEHLAHIRKSLRARFVVHVESRCSGFTARRQRLELDIHIDETVAPADLELHDSAGLGVIDQIVEFLDAGDFLTIDVNDQIVGLKAGSTAAQANFEPHPRQKAVFVRLH